MLSGIGPEGRFVDICAATLPVRRWRGPVDLKEQDGRLGVGGERRDVLAGSLVFVAAHVPHQFRDITERLVILVVFGPGEGRRA